MEFYIVDHQNDLSIYKMINIFFYCNQLLKEPKIYFKREAIYKDKFCVKVILKSNMCIQFDFISNRL